MSLGEGPPAVLAWLRGQGDFSPSPEGWTVADEGHARVLARRLAKRLNRPRPAESDAGLPATTSRKLDGPAGSTGEARSPPATRPGRSHEKGGHD
jgi:hypothetical protein